MSAENINIASLPNNWVNCGLMYVNEKSQLKQYVCTICLKNNDNQINDDVYTSVNPYEFWKHFIDHMPGTATSDSLEETGKIDVNCEDTNVLDKNKITDSNIFQVNLFKSNNKYNNNSTSKKMDNYDELEHISKYMKSCSNEASIEISDSEESVDLYFGEIPQEDVNKYTNYERKPMCDEMRSDYPEIISCIDLKKDVCTELGFENLQVQNAEEEKVCQVEAPEVEILIQESQEKRSSDEIFHVNETNTDILTKQYHKELLLPPETTLSIIQKEHHKTHENIKEPTVTYSKTEQTPSVSSNKISKKKRRPTLERTKKTGTSNGSKRQVNENEIKKAKVSSKHAPTLKLISLWDISSEPPKSKPASKQEKLKGPNRTTNLSVSASQNTRFLKYMSKQKIRTSNVNQSNKNRMSGNAEKRTSISPVKISKDANIEYVCHECAASFKTERARETHMKRTHVGLTVDVLSEQQEQAEKNKLKEQELLKIKQEVNDSDEEFNYIETEQQQPSMPDLTNEKDQSSSKSVADVVQQQPVKEQRTPQKYVIPKRKGRIQHDTTGCMPLGGLSVVEQQQATAKKLKTISSNLISPEKSKKPANKNLKKGCQESPEVGLKASDQHQYLATVLQQRNDNVEKNPTPKKSDFAAGVKQSNQPSYLRSNTEFQKSFIQYKQYEMNHQPTTFIDSRKQIPISHDVSNHSQYNVNHTAQFSYNNNLNTSNNLNSSQHQVFGQTQHQPQYSQQQQQTPQQQQQQQPPIYPPHEQQYPKHPPHQQQPQYSQQQQQPKYPPHQQQPQYSQQQQQQTPPQQQQQPQYSQQQQQPKYPSHQQQPKYPPYQQQQQQPRYPQQQSQYMHQQTTQYFQKQTPQYIQQQYPKQHYQQQMQQQAQQRSSRDFLCQNDSTTQYTPCQYFPNCTFQQNRYRLPQDFGSNVNFQQRSYEPIQELPQYYSNCNFHPNNSSQQFIIRNEAFYTFSQQGQ